MSADETLSGRQFNQELYGRMPFVTPTYQGRWDSDPHVHKTLGHDEFNTPVYRDGYVSQPGPESARSPNTVQFARRLQETTDMKYAKHISKAAKREAQGKPPQQTAFERLNPTAARPGSVVSKKGKKWDKKHPPDTYNPKHIK